MGLKGLKNIPPHESNSPRLSRDVSRQMRAGAEAENKELLFKPNQEDEMASEKGEGKEPPCEDLKLG